MGKIYILLVLDLILQMGRGKRVDPYVKLMGDRSRRKETGLAVKKAAEKVEKTIMDDMKKHSLTLDDVSVAMKDVDAKWGDVHLEPEVKVKCGICAMKGKPCKTHEWLYENKGDPYFKRAVFAPIMKDPEIWNI